MSPDEVSFTFVGSICITIFCEIVPAAETGIAAVRSSFEPGVVVEGAAVTVTAGVVAEAGTVWPTSAIVTTSATAVAKSAPRA